MTNLSTLDTSFPLVSFFSGSFYEYSVGPSYTAELKFCLKSLPNIILVSEINNKQNYPFIDYISPGST